MSRKHRIETELVHAGEPSPRVDGAVVLPIFQSATYESADETGYHDVRYVRLNNTPNHLALHAKLSVLEGTESALVTASGMAAISTAILTFVGAGDHIIAQNSLYGGTHTLFMEEFPAMGIDVDLVDGADPGSWESKLRPSTKAIYMESISNPTIMVPELEAVVEFARAHKLVSMIDNTFATPVNFRPATIGFDIVVHSATKYLNGHTDVGAGAIAGSTEHIEKIRHKLNHLGATLDPHACFLLHRGLKTLALRVRHQCESALAIAQFLEGHQAVGRVNYAGLASNPHHERASRYFEAYGGMLSFELTGGAGAAKRLLKRVEIPRVAPSLGGVESLLTIPALTSHAGLRPEERAALGVPDGMVRMSVGIEAAQDLIEDLDQALKG